MFFFSQDCELLENEVCKLEYAIAKRHPLIGQQFETAECSKLPEIGSVESEGCLKLGMPEPDPVNPDEKCYWGVGESYRGNIDASASGHQCIQWNHQTALKTSEYPSLLGGHRYCRNPGGQENQPWCFVEDIYHVKRELCNIPQCGN